MGFLCLLSAALLLALGILPYVEGGTEEDAVERPALATLLVFALLLGTNWALALLHRLDAPSLWICTGVYALAGALLLYLRRRGTPGRPKGPGPGPLVLLGAAGLLAAGLYMLLRGALVPMWEFDALSYHYPKAVEVLRTHGIPHIPSGDFRVVYFPWNYELLIADAFLMTPGDGLIHLIGMLATFGFGAFAYAAFRRSWPRTTGTDAFLGALFVLATPVLVLQTADFKNDVLFAFFMLSFLHWAALWGPDGKPRELVLALLSLGLAFGTKANALFLIPVFAGIVWHFRGRLRPRAGSPGRLVAWGAGLLLLFVLTGSAWPLLNKAWCGHWLGDFARVGGVDGFESNAVPRYIGFANLWRFPILALLRPFASGVDRVWVFWRHEYWWWPGNRSLYCHFGWLCSLLPALLPFGIRQHRREDGEAPAFRVFLSAGILGFVLFCLPQRYRVDGMFCGFPRALLCIPVLVALWTLLPVLAWLRERKWTLLSVLAGLGLLAYYGGQSYTYLRYDETKSYQELVWCLDHPDHPKQFGLYQAFNQVAGPSDPVAYDGGFGGFFYPLYGPDLARPLRFIPHGAHPLPVPEESKWVVIDRAWNVGWSHPGVRSTAEFGRPIQRAPSEEDLELFGQLFADPAWALVYNDPGMNQAIFVRRSALRS